MHLKLALMFLSGFVTLVLSGCTNIIRYSDDLYVKGRWQPRPLSSTIEVECRATEAFEGVPFMLSYNLLLNVTPYPEKKDSREIRGKWCQTGVRPHFTHNGIGYWYEDRGRSRDITGGNRDPVKGAVRTWDLSGVRMDGAQWDGPYLSFRADIMEGNRLPLGGNFTVFHLKQFHPQLLEPAREFTQNGLTWRHETWKKVWVGGGTSTPNGTVEGILEIYRAKVGQHTILVYAVYMQEVIDDANWFTQRQALLRSWVDSFKVLPLPKDTTGLVFVPDNQTGRDKRDKEREQQKNAPPSKKQPVQKRSPI